MKVICKPKNENDLRKELLNFGELFTVYAMLKISEIGLFEFLIASPNCTPEYHPSHLFEIIDHTLPLEWGYTEWEINNELNCQVWGYPEILNYDHHHGLIEGDKAAYAKFFKARKIMDDRTWITGEKEVLSALIQTNGLSEPASFPYIDCREKTDRFLRTYFFQPHKPIFPEEKKEANLFVEVLVNEQKKPGYCFILVKDGQLRGFELFMYDDPLPEVISELELIR